MAKATTKLKRFPSISIVTATFNSCKTLEECLRRIRTQNYNQKKIEIILGDGGSTDSTSEVAKKYNAKVVNIPPTKQNAEYNRGVAFNKAKKELVLILDHDNFMTTKNYLRELVQPLVDHQEVVASESCYYHYDKKYSLLDRYYALFGTHEAIPYYFGKADKMNQTSKKWNLLGDPQDCGDYYLVKFESDPRRIPTIGTNGCLMRRKLVIDNADTRPSHHYPIDVMVDVIQSGHNTFAFVKNSLIHLIGARGVVAFLRRRMMFMERYHFEDNSKRRYSVYMPGDEWNLLKFLFYSFTIVRPLFDAVRGYLIIPDSAWFLHPIMCLGISFTYGWGTIKSLVTNPSRVSTFFKHN